MSEEGRNILFAHFIFVASILSCVASDYNKSINIFKTHTHYDKEQNNQNSNNITVEFIAMHILCYIRDGKHLLGNR
jgi:hypothetical protein